MPPHPCLPKATIHYDAPSESSKNFAGAEKIRPGLSRSRLLLAADMVFHPLDGDSLAAITRQLLDQTGERLSALGVSLQVEEDAVRLLARAGSDRFALYPLAEWFQRTVRAQEPQHPKARSLLPSAQARASLASDHLLQCLLENGAYPQP